MTSSIQGQSKIRVRREMREISIPQSATSACAYDEAAKKMDGSMKIHHKPWPFVAVVLSSADPKKCPLAGRLRIIFLLVLFSLMR